MEKELYPAGFPGFIIAYNILFIINIYHPLKIQKQDFRIIIGLRGRIFSNSNNRVNFVEKTPGHEIVIAIDSVEQIFNAPELDPFSERDIDVLGEAALMRMVKRLLAGGWRKRKGARLVFILPSDKITPGLQQEVVQAVHRYCAAKIEENRLQIRLGRRMSLLGLVLVILIVLALGGIGYLLWAPISANTSAAAQGIIIGIFSVFAWVMLWDPMEKLLFGWVEPSQESRILRGIMELEIVIKDQPLVDSQP